MARRNYTDEFRRRVRTTVLEPSDEKVPDLLKRDFTAEQPNTKYVGNITYLPIADGTNLYLATVVDCCSRSSRGERSPTTCAPRSSRTPSWRPGGLGQPAWRDLPRRPRSPGHLQGLRPALQEPRRDLVPGRGRVECRQRTRRVVRRDPEARPSPEPNDAVAESAQSSAAVTRPGIASASSASRSSGTAKPATIMRSVAAAYSSR